LPKENKQTNGTDLKPEAKERDTAFCVNPASVKTRKKMKGRMAAAQPTKEKVAAVPSTGRR
jgi:hypothetical protein